MDTYLNRLNRSFLPLAAALLSVALAAGCASTSSTQGAPAEPAQGSSGKPTQMPGRLMIGTLTGHLLTVGGPAPGSPRGVAGSVTISGPDGRHEVQVGPDGAYRINLQPGTYTVLGHLTGYPSAPPSGALDGAVVHGFDCPAAAAAKVDLNTVTTADALCQIR